MESFNRLLLSFTYLFLLFFLSGCGGGPSTEKIFLGRPQVGNERTMIISTRRNAGITVKNQEQQVSQILEILYNMKVLSVSGHSMEIQTTFEDLIFEEQSIMGHFVYDSRNPEPDMPPTIQRFAALPGNSFVMTVSQDWKILGVQGLKDIVKRAEKPGGAEQKINLFKGNALTLGEDEISEEAILETMEMALSVFPKINVSQDSTWSEQTTISAAQFPSIENSHYTINVTENEVEVTIEKEISPNTENPGLAPGIKCEVRGSGKGKIRFDRNTGWPRNGELFQKVNGSITSPLLKTLDKDSGNGKFPVWMITQIQFEVGI